MHQTKKTKFVVHQQGATCAEICNLGPMGCIRLKKKKLWCISRGPNVLKMAVQDLLEASEIPLC